MKKVDFLDSKRDAYNTNDCYCSFWDWHRYDDVVIAYEEKIGAWDNISANIYEEHEDDEELDDDEIQEEIATVLKDILFNEYTCIELDDGSILVRGY